MLTTDAPGRDTTSGKLTDGLRVLAPMLHAKAMNEAVHCTGSLYLCILCRQILVVTDSERHFPSKLQQSYLTHCTSFIHLSKVTVMQHVFA